MHPPRHCYLVTDSLCQVSLGPFLWWQYYLLISLYNHPLYQIQIMFQSENVQPFVTTTGPHHTAMSYLPNCAMVQNRYQTQPFGRNPNYAMYHSMAHLPQQPGGDHSSHCQPSFNQKHVLVASCHLHMLNRKNFLLRRSISQLNLCTVKYEDEVLHQKEACKDATASKSHCEKFNALNHPLMAIDCRGGGAHHKGRESETSSRSLSPTSSSADSGVSSSSSTASGYRPPTKSPRSYSILSVDIWKHFVYTYFCFS